MEREQSVKDENDEKLMQKFRKVFPDKSRNALSKTFAAFRKQVELKQSATSSGKMPNSFNLIEFKIAMVKGFENKFSFQEIKRIFERLDCNNSGRISVDEFIIGVRGSLNPRRQQFVNFLFQHLDKEGKGYLDAPLLADVYSKLPLPDILSGKIGAAEKAADFVRKNGSGDKVTREQFSQYYLTRSLKVAKDSKFIADGLDQWLIKEEVFEDWCATAPSRNPILKHVASADSLVSSLHSQQAYNGPLIAQLLAEREAADRGAPTTIRSAQGAYGSDSRLSSNSSKLSKQGQSGPMRAITRASMELSVSGQQGGGQGGSPIATPNPEKPSVPSPSKKSSRRSSQLGQMEGHDQMKLLGISRDISLSTMSSNSDAVAALPVIAPGGGGAGFDAHTMLSMKSASVHVILAQKQLIEQQLASLDMEQLPESDREILDCMVALVRALDKKVAEQEAIIAAQGQAMEQLTKAINDIQASLGF